MKTSSLKKKTLRFTQKSRCRPISDLGLQQMQEWFDEEGLVLEPHENDQHEMANVFMKT